MPRSSYIPSPVSILSAEDKCQAVLALIFLKPLTSHSLQGFKWALMLNIQWQWWDLRSLGVFNNWAPLVSRNSHTWATSSKKMLLVGEKVGKLRHWGSFRRLSAVIPSCTTDRFFLWHLLPLPDLSTVPSQFWGLCAHDILMVSFHPSAILASTEFESVFQGKYHMGIFSIGKLQTRWELTFLGSSVKMSVQLCSEWKRELCHVTQNKPT